MLNFIPMAFVVRKNLTSKTDNGLVLRDEFFVKKLCSCFFKALVFYGYYFLIDCGIKKTVNPN
jgi:hypothetical protein